MIRQSGHRFPKKITRLEHKQSGIEAIKIDPALLLKKDSRLAGGL
jgi:hypothetical protein